MNTIIGLYLTILQIRNLLMVCSYLIRMRDGKNSKIILAVNILDCIE